MATSGSVRPKTDPDGPPPSADPTEHGTSWKSLIGTFDGRTTNLTQARVFLEDFNGLVRGKGWNDIQATTNSVSS